MCVVLLVLSNEAEPSLKNLKSVILTVFVTFSPKLFTLTANIVEVIITARSGL